MNPITCLPISPLTAFSCVSVPFHGSGILFVLLLPFCSLRLQKSAKIKREALCCSVLGNQPWLREDPARDGNANSSDSLTVQGPRKGRSKCSLGGPSLLTKFGTVQYGSYHLVLNVLPHVLACVPRDTVACRLRNCHEDNKFMPESRKSSHMRLAAVFGLFTLTILASSIVPVQGGQLQKYNCSSALTSSALDSAAEGLGCTCYFTPRQCPWNLDVDCKNILQATRLYPSFGMNPLHEHKKFASI